MNDHENHRQLIAQSPVCQIERCMCGTIHMTLGPLTLRLQDDALVPLWSTLGDAIMRLSAESGSAILHPHAPMAS